MRTFRLLVVRRLVQSPVRTLTTALAVAAGVTLAVSISVLLSSIDRSLDEFSSALAGPADLRITGATLRGGLPVDALGAASAVDGVEAVVPVVQTVAPTQSGPGAPPESTLVLGVDCGAEALFGAFGCDPIALAAHAGPLAVGPATPVGEGAVLRTDLGRLPLAGTPVTDALAGLGDGRVVVLPLPLAQERYTRPGRVDVAYVLLRDGADPAAARADLQAAVGDHLPVLTADEPPAGASGVLGAALPIYSMLGLFALGIGGVLVSSTAAMSLESRRRELATLGALGGRRRTVFGATIAEQVVIGALGGLLGSVGGAVVARPIVQSLSGFTESVAGVALDVHLPPSTVVTGVLLGMLLGAAAAVLPARRAARADVAAELAGREGADQAKPVRLGRRVALWGAVAVAGAVGCWLAPRDGGLEPWQAGIVTPSFLALTVGTLFAGAALAPVVAARLGVALSSVAWAPARIALAAARRDHRRTAVLAVCVAAAVSTAFVTEGSSGSARRSIESSFERSGDGVDVATVPQNEGFGAQLPPDLVAAATALPGVADAQIGRFLVAGRDRDLTLVRAVQGERFTFDPIDGEADTERLAAGEVIIGAGLARAQGIRAGDTVRVPTPGGVVELPVQGVWNDGNNVGRNVTMSTALMEQLYGPQPVDFLSLRPTDGVSEAELAAQVEAAGLDPELRTRPSAVVADDIADQVDEQFASFRVMQLALLAVLFVAVLTSLLLAAVQRRRELGLLAAVGADPPGLARTFLVEAGLVSALGVGLSLVSGPLTMWGLNNVVPFVVGFKNPLTFEWGTLAVTGVAAVAVALIGSVWPAARAARVEVLDALRYE